MPRSGSHRGRQLAIFAAVPVLTLTLLPSPAFAELTAAGAPGIGDPYFPLYGNGGYDVSHYDVAVEVDGPEIVGKTTITAKATQSLSRFNLDFVLDTSSVKVNGETAKFSHKELHELVVTPAKPIAKGDKMTVVVTYRDDPSTVFDNGINPVYQTSPGFLILGEPESAPWWIPGNDHPRDKATYDLEITVPSGTEAISAGRLVSKQTVAAKDTWHWQVNQPTTGYLLFLAAGEYDVEKSTVEGRPTWTAIGAGTGTAGELAKADFDRMDEVVPFLESQFGKYHFDTHGNVVVNATVGFALETQTRPVYAPAFWRSGQSNLSVVVHEQAHQWFGDNVSVHNWRDVWLNEGFATWSQWRWEEAEGGDTANEILMAYYNAHPEGDTFWNRKIGDPGAGALFAGEVYDRGAMTVQALRNRIGNADLLELFGKWQSKHEYDDASIADFHKLAEKVSGENLDSFFENWLYTSARPKATKDNGLAGFDAAVTATQPQDLESWDRLVAATALLASGKGHDH